MPRKIYLKMEEIEESLPIVAYVRMRDLSLSFYTFQENYNLLKKHLLDCDDVDFQLKLEHKPLQWQYHSFQQEIYRLLLNLVSSAMALVEHTRNIVRKTYASSEFLEEYQDKIEKELKNEPVNKFFQDFRSYILHNQFPFVGTHISLRRVVPIGDPDNLFDAKVRLVLNKAELLMSGKWTQPSKVYLDSHGDRIFVDSLIDEYYSLIEDFHSWLNERHTAMHEPECSFLLEQWEQLYRDLKESLLSGDSSD